MPVVDTKPLRVGKLPLPLQEMSDIRFSEAWLCVLSRAYTGTDTTHPEPYVHTDAIAYACATDTVTHGRTDAESDSGAFARAHRASHEAPHSRSDQAANAVPDWEPLAVAHTGAHREPHTGTDCVADACAVAVTHHESDTSAVGLADAGTDAGTNREPFTGTVCIANACADAVTNREPDASTVGIADTSTDAVALGNANAGTDTISDAARAVLAGLPSQDGGDAALHAVPAGTVRCRAPL